MFKTRTLVFRHFTEPKQNSESFKISFTLQISVNKFITQTMHVKIDTKERFTVITPQEPHLSVNMTEELNDLLLGYLQKGIPHVILKMEAVQTVDELIAEHLAAVQQQFYEQNCSFVICNLQKDVVQLLKTKDLLEVMNIAPTESEAWDILQMEEIERELLGDA